MKKTALFLAYGVYIISTGGAHAENILLTCKYSDGSGHMELDISEDRVMLGDVLLKQVKDIKIGARYITYNSAPVPSNPDQTSEEYVIDRSTGMYTNTTIWPNSARRNVYTASCQKSDSSQKKF
jgi:hypothetical protein